LADAAWEVLGWARYYPGWGHGILDEYRHHPELASFIAALENTPLRAGDNVRPPPEAGEIIYNHLSLVRRLARDRSTTVVDDRGVPAINDSLFSDLEGVGKE